MKSLQSTLLCSAQHLAHLSLKEGTQPCLRSVPYAIKEQVRKELDHFEKVDILQRVDYAKWAAPIMPVPKGCRTTLGWKEKHFPLCSASNIFISISYGRQFIILISTDHYTWAKTGCASLSCCPHAALGIDVVGLFIYNPIPPHRSPCQCRYVVEVGCRS